MDMSTTFRPSPSRAGSGFEVDHLWCCDPDRSWCGLDISAETVCPADCEHDECALCALAETGLPDCEHQEES